ncbi:myelin-associated glycoprotein-like [Trematomus bernacchii]|uniref:myelin-associated glycoprotein-like n=1 Tax=Trematomus bernacchii TaxID=40690 RepID=UPI00146BC790|nr:myelin-associated glycoprotein-like [Trematomus bernacchii]
MTGASKVFLLLLQGSLCLKWEITMPLRIDGLTGSCVKVPCTFDIDSMYDVNLDNSCKAIWIRGSTAGINVFDSSLTGDQASGNILKGNLTGNLQNKECTTIFYNMPPSHSDNYYFRIQCDHRLKANYPTGVRITTQNSLDQPTITPSTLEVEEGALVTLSCTAVAPCPILPPDLTWTPRIGDIEETHESESMVSVMNFTSSYLNNGQNFSCTALYKPQAGNTDLRFEKFMTLHVLYPPTNTSVSYSATVKEGSLVNLTCNGNANPAVYTWYKVNGGQVTDVGSGKRFSTTVSEVDRQFYCKVSNRYGTQNSSITQIDVQYLPKNISVSVDPSGPVQDSFAFNMSLCKTEKGLHSLSIGIGFAVGALGMLLVCLPLLLIYYRKGKVIASSDKGKAETCNPIITNAINSSEVDVVYGNEAFLEMKEVDGEEPLHYVNVDSAKLQEITGLDSETAEYAEIQSI